MNGFGRSAVTEDTLMIEPPPPALHMRDGIAAHIYHAHQVDGRALKPVFGRGVHYAAHSSAAAHIVMQDMQPAETLNGLIHNGFAIGGVGCVGDGCNRFAALLRDDCAGGVCPFDDGVH